MRVALRLEARKYPCPVCAGSGRVEAPQGLGVALLDAIGESPLQMTDGEYQTMKEGR